MGLDMYGFKPTTISLEDLSNVTKTSDIINDYCCLLKEDVDNNDAYIDLKPYMVLKELETDVLDIDAIIKDYPEYHYITRYYGEDAATFVMKDRTRVEILHLSKYIKTIKREFYIYSYYEIAYWRKAYALIDRIEEFLKPRELENCGWYWLDADDWDLIRQNMYSDINDMEEDLKNNQNYSEKEKEDLEWELDKYKRWTEEIPSEDCFFHAWW